ncbi:hypothetical protein BGZ76_006886, partial [Entomortierella beljakovae]
TPIGVRSIRDGTVNPLRKGETLKVNRYFYDTLPAEWLPENYAQQYKGDTKGFNEGLETMCGWNRFSLRVAVRELLEYFKSSHGQKQLQLLSQAGYF